MGTALETYRRIVTEQPDCDVVWFESALARYRAGDEPAGREITGRCLRLGLSIVERDAGSRGETELLELIQEANAGLCEALQSFSGAGISDFHVFAEQVIRQRLASTV